MPIAKKKKGRIKIFDNLKCFISKEKNKSKGRRGKGIN